MAMEDSFPGGSDGKESEPPGNLQDYGGTIFKELKDIC